MTRARKSLDINHHQASAPSDTPTHTHDDPRCCAGMAPPASFLQQYPEPIYLVCVTATATATPTAKQNAADWRRKKESSTKANTASISPQNEAYLLSALYCYYNTASSVNHTAVFDTLIKTTPTPLRITKVWYTHIHGVYIYICVCV